MKKYLLLASLVFAGWLLPAVAQQVTQPSTSATPGALPAQTSATSANAGAIGEFVSVSSNDESIAVTITHATPAVVTMTANTFAARCVVAAGSSAKCVSPIVFSGLTGVGIANATVYYVDPASISGSTFKVATTVANALAGTDVATTGTDSGTGVAAAYITTAGTAQPIMALSLPAGDWDCTASVTYMGLTGVIPAGAQIDLNTSATTVDFTDGSITALRWSATGMAQNAQFNSLAANNKRFLNASATTAYLLGEYNWTGAPSTNPTAEGTERCRRVQ